MPEPTLDFWVEAAIEAVQWAQTCLANQENSAALKRLPWVQARLVTELLKNENGAGGDDGTPAPSSMEATMKSEADSTTIPANGQVRHPRLHHGGGRRLFIVCRLLRCVRAGVSVPRATSGLEYARPRRRACYTGSSVDSGLELAAQAWPRPRALCCRSAGRLARSLAAFFAVFRLVHRRRGRCSSLAPSLDGPNPDIIDVACCSIGPLGHHRGVKVDCRNRDV
jgi:hypothetical protein